MSQVSGAILLIVLVVFVIAYLSKNIMNTGSQNPQPQSADTTEVVQNQKAKKSSTKQKTASKKSEKKSSSKTASDKQTAAASAATTAALGTTMSSFPYNPETDLLPKLDFQYTSQVIKHLGYVVSYNADYKVPNWVLYELNYAETLGNIPRNNAFDVDPEVPEKQMAQLTDYRNSGYDRGHMAPNADLNWDVQAQNESFYLSNMTPQGHDFNAGIWLDLENQVRDWAERDSAVTIVCGPVLPKTKAAADKMKKIGKGKVLVPEQFYKVVLAPFHGEVRAIAFLMPNHNEKEGKKNKSLESYVVSVDSIESLTGIDFFPSLPDKIENKIEAKYNLSEWF